MERKYLCWFVSQAFECCNSKDIRVASPPEGGSENLTAWDFSGETGSNPKKNWHCSMAKNGAGEFLGPFQSFIMIISTLRQNKAGSH